MIVKIKRQTDYASYNVDIPKNFTVLELLHKIKEQDPTLSYRHMCRAGICGTCGIKANGKGILACKTKLDYFDTDEILLEPLDNFEPIKDLVVNHQKAFDKYKSLRVDFVYKDNIFNFKSVENSKNCIACFLCNSVCPVITVDKDFATPFVFARSYGILEDDRNQNKDYKKLLEGVINHCTHCKNCTYACPSYVMPEYLIKKLEDKLIDVGLLQKPSTDMFFGF